MPHHKYKDATDFGKFIEKTIEESDTNLVLRLSAFAQTLLEYISKGRLYNTEEYLCTLEETIDLSKLINQSDNSLVRDVKIIVIGRFILLTASCMRERIKCILMDDFPKYLGDRSNFWRYLADMISKYSSEVNPDFTTQFLVANACFIELLDHCFRLNQFQTIKNDQMFLMGITLLFFGERLKGGEEETAVLELNAKTIEGIDLAVNGPKKQKTKGKKKSDLVLTRQK